MAKKKIFSTRLDVDRLKDLKHLAVDTDKSLGNLLEEAIKDIVDKYKKKIRKWSFPQPRGASRTNPSIQRRWKMLILEAETPAGDMRFRYTLAVESIP